MPRELPSLRRQVLHRHPGVQQIPQRSHLRAVRPQLHAHEQPLLRYGLPLQNIRQQQGRTLPQELLRQEPGAVSGHAIHPERHPPR